MLFRPSLRSGQLLDTRQPGVSRRRALVPNTLANLAYWFNPATGLYQTSGGSAASADSDPVGEWQDQSGNGRHLAQATADKRFTLRTGANGLNGRPILEADGGNDQMTATIPVSTTWTHILVCRKRSAPTANTHYLAVLGNTGARPATHSAVHATGWFYALNQTGTNEVLGGTATAWQILVFRYASASSCQVYSGGVLLGSLDPNDAYNGTILNLASALAGTNFMDADFADVLGYTVARTNAELNGLASYLRLKYPSLPWSNL